MTDNNKIKDDDLNNVNGGVFVINGLTFYSSIPVLYAVKNWVTGDIKLTLQEEAAKCADVTSFNKLLEKYYGECPQLKQLDSRDVATMYANLNLFLNS